MKRTRVTLNGKAGSSVVDAYDSTTGNYIGNVLSPYGSGWVYINPIGRHIFTPDVKPEINVVVDETMYSEIDG